MGLLDILNGMQNGPRGERQPSSGGGGMSPLTMALIGLLAYKAIKSFGGQPGTSPAGTGSPTKPEALPRGTTTASVPETPARPAGGGLSDLMKGGLGGLLAGGAAGTILGGGLSDLLKQLQQSGHGDVADSWVGTGPNKSISPNELAQALGSDEIDALAEQSGMPRDEMMAGFSEQLPDVVDQLTPNGRLPTQQEWSRWA
jgi:uncharacterized protein YidB (DUF937 family)